MLYISYMYVYNFFFFVKKSYQCYLFPDRAQIYLSRSYTDTDVIHQMAVKIIHTEKRRLYFSHAEFKSKNLRGQTCQLILNDEIVNARLCNRCLLTDTFC